MMVPLTLKPPTIGVCIRIPLVKKACMCQTEHVAQPHRHDIEMCVLSSNSCELRQHGSSGERQQREISCVSFPHSCKGATNEHIRNDYCKNMHHNHRSNKNNTAA